MDRIKETLLEVFYAVFPVSIFVFILHLTVVRMPVEMIIRFFVGTLLVFGGLVLFLLGVRVSLLPMGEMMGSALLKTGKILVIVLFAFVLGFIVTIAEPPVMVFANQVQSVTEGGLPRDYLVYTIALGVAISLCLAMGRIVYRVPLFYLLVPGYILIFIFAAITPSVFVPIAFDAGGVTTGPLTVPFILALGVGVAAFFRADKSTSDGFGLVGLASIGPVLAVLIMGLLIS